MNLSRRFYRAVTVAPAPDGFRIKLDERGLRSPARRELVLPTRALAEAIAEEWRAQGDEIVPATMPLMQIAATAVDRVAAMPAETAAAIVSYAGADLLCYRAEAPAALVERQQRLWQPILDWAALHLDAPFVVTTGVMHRPQPQAALAAVQAAIAGLDPFRLAALSLVTAAAGSVVLALAVRAGRIDPATAAALSQLDERFQAEQWGEDVEALIRRESLQADILAAGRFLALLGA
jgi:chaperone required for assembly of F1-ATPase